MDAVLTKPLTQAHAVDMLNTFISTNNIKKSITKPQTDLPDTDDELFELNQFLIFNEDEGLKNCDTHEMLRDLLNMMIDDLPEVGNLCFYCRFINGLTE